MRALHPVVRDYIPPLVYTHGAGIQGFWQKRMCENVQVPIQN
ncbi:MAG: hypothetical protein AAF919_01920 [Pseudomonadota bacterium]